MVPKRNVILQSYKHDQSLHRVWKTETILEDNDEYIVVANKKTRVVENNGRYWYTREPSISFLFKKHWFNVVAIIKGDEITYYCNICSPILQDDEALKYIDYDLDIKVEPDFTYNILDVNEYKRNRNEMDYPEDIKKILNLELDVLEKRINDRDFPFQEELIWKWYKLFNELDEEESK